MRRLLKQPQVSLTLAQSAGQQQIAGEHLVGSDGRVNLGIYGSVYVAGMTVIEARHAIETHLTRFLDDPRVAVDVGAYNSKVYYVITEGAGFGDSVSRFPVTGNETVLDAMSQINGLSRLASKSHIWIARPVPEGNGCDQILPIYWDKITRDGETATNYQVCRAIEFSFPPTSSMPSTPHWAMSSRPSSGSSASRLWEFNRSSEFNIRALGRGRMPAAVTSRLVAVN